MSHALVIGGGPAGLMAADVVSQAGHAVTVADQMPSVGRKFLMAGKSGLNLTKDEPTDLFLAAFGDIPQHAKDAIWEFDPAKVQSWARSLGQTVFTGSTGRVFPDVMKASPLLRAWLARLDNAGVTFQRRWHWTGWDGGKPVFATPDGKRVIEADAVILAVGGKSWPRLGSDGAWAEFLPDTAPFTPANCGFMVEWSSHMERYFGTPVKGTRLRAGELVSRGEWVITSRGMEGGGIYSVSAAVRDGANLHIDLLPDVDPPDLREKLAKRPAKYSRKEVLQKTLRLSPAKIALINEWGDLQDISDTAKVISSVKSLRAHHSGPLPMDGAISTAGGLRWAAIDDHFMLRAHPGVFAAGEMLDWEAPTGGYLITGCLAMGHAAGVGALGWLKKSK